MLTHQEGQAVRYRRPSIVVERIPVLAVGLFVGWQLGNDEKIDSAGVHRGERRMKKKLLNGFGFSPRPHRLLTTVLVCTIVAAVVITASSVAGADNWAKREQAPSTSPRRFFGMAYIGDDKVLLFGGEDWIVGVNDETWLYDLSAGTWTQKNPASKPSARKYHAMAYIGDDKILLHGGSDSNQNDLVSRHV